MRRRPPTPLAFHGVAIRSRDPRRLARRLRALLGWGVLRESAGETVLGDGPELWIAIRRAAKGSPEGVDELHLAVEKIGRSRRKTEEDALGGDSWWAPVEAALTLVVRELRRAPRKAWVKRRPRP